MDTSTIHITPIIKEVLPNRVSEAIMDFAAKNHLQAGDRLPSERVLAAEFGIGRNSVRDGLLALEQKGMIIRHVGKGAFLQQSISTDKVSLKLKQVNYRDLLEIKVHLDQLALEKAIINGTKEEFQKLEQIALEMMEQARQQVFTISLDRSFHTLIYECSGSNTLKQLVLNIVDALDNYKNTWINPIDSWLKTIPYHLDIARALLSNNLILAQAANTYIYQLDLKILSDEGDTSI